MIIWTHVITLTRPGVGAGAQTTIYTGRQVQIDFGTTSKKAQARAMGAQYQPVLYDAVNTLYQINDIVTITGSKSGTIPTVTQYQCGAPDPSDGLLPYMTVTLTAFAGLHT